MMGKRNRTGNGFDSIREQINRALSLGEARPNEIWKRNPIGFRFRSLDAPAFSILPFRPRTTSSFGRRPSSHPKEEKRKRPPGCYKTARRRRIDGEAMKTVWRREMLGFSVLFYWLKIKSATPPSLLAAAFAWLKARPFFFDVRYPSTPSTQKSPLARLHLHHLFRVVCKCDRRRPALSLPTARFLIECGKCETLWGRCNNDKSSSDRDIVGSGFFLFFGSVYCLHSFPPSIHELLDTYPTIRFMSR